VNPVFVLLYFALTLFTSATLLFFVQPMIGKMILPRLGGTPAVWNTCMVFFQAVLLLGYGYTHFVSTRLSRRTQLILQAGILLTPLIFLPFSLGTWTPPGDSNPIFSVLWILMIVVGVPFFVVSTSAPLLQKWFAFTEHPSSKDPYFLYGASNLGSMLALVLYPVVMEPNFAVPEQSKIWLYCYVGFVALMAGGILYLWNKTAPTLAADPLPAQPSPSASPATAITADLRPSRLGGAAAPKPVERRAATAATPMYLRRLRWIALAAVPSSLMLGLTTFMTTDIAAIPFFWVLPLALYLLTFIFVFARWPVVWTATPKGPPAPLWVPTVAMIVGCLSVFIGFGIHLFSEQYRSPYTPGPSHILYAVAFLSIFVYWVASGTGSPHEFVLYFQPCFLLFLVLWIVGSLQKTLWLEFTLHLASFFFVTLMCHGELAKDRPSAEHLTEFYLCMSIGGVLGGLFNVLVAPFVFWFWLLEYPLAMVLSCFLRPFMVGRTTFLPGDSNEDQRTPLGIAYDLAIPLAITVAAYFLVQVDDQSSALSFLHDWDPRFAGWNSRHDPRPTLRNFVMAAPIVAALALAMRPLRFGLAVAGIWFVAEYYDQKDVAYIRLDRGFFGMVKVKKIEARSTETGSSYHTLIHGGIDHGRQHVDPRRHHEPCAYFHPLTGIGQVFMKFSWPNTPLPASVSEYERDNNPYSHFTLPNWRLPASLVGAAANPLAGLVDLHSEPPFAVVGLGTGTLAAFAKPYQALDIYEIDPLVLRLSTTYKGEPPPFTYLEDAKARGANLNVILGDGRLKIEKAPEQWYHIIVLDAFASDAIPVHLLTLDAVELYLKKLAPGGVLIFNTTNRYVTINGVLKDIADHLDLECIELGNWYTRVIPEQYGTDFVVLRRSEKAVRELGGSFSGGPSLAKRLDHERYEKLMNDIEAVRDVRYPKGEGDYNWGWRRWREPKNLGGRLWTDSYSNLLGVLKIGS
jgi:hypothetical protein